jgi:hypothetical protein
MLPLLPHACIFLLFISVLRSSAADICGIANLTQYQRFDPVERWHYEPNNPCGYHNLSPDEINHIIGKKKILFIGDSSVRNTALAVLSSTCNPEHHYKCAQIMTLPFLRQEEGIISAFECMNESASNTCGEIKHHFTIIKNLTQAEFYRTPEERRKFWKTKNVPPLLTMTHRNITMHILEAGCANHRDGLWVILDYLINHHVTFAYDMIVMSGGLHCMYRHYKGGQWYLSLFERFRFFRDIGVPIVWIEVTHCLKTDAGHWMKSPDKKGKWEINFRKLVSCAWIDKHIHFMNKGVEREGMVLSPTRHITPNLTMHYKSKTDRSLRINDSARTQPCIFMDPIHPCVECYGAIAQTLIRTVDYVIRDEGRWRVRDPSLIEKRVHVGEYGVVDLPDAAGPQRAGQAALSSSDVVMMSDGTFKAFGIVAAVLVVAVAGVFLRRFPGIVGLGRRRK